MRKLWLLAAAASLLLVARAPQVQAQDASVVATCGTLTLPTGYAVAPLTQDTTGTLCTSAGGGGGGAATIANGADVAEGNTADAAATIGSTGTVSAKLRTITTELNTLNTTLGSPLQAGGNVVVTGTVPLPTLAATSTKQSDGSQKTQIVDGSGNVIASTSNSLNVQCANCSGSGASATDGATFTAGSSTFAPSGVFYQTTPTNNPLTDGKQGQLQGTANRAAFVNLRNASGTEIGTSTTPVQVSLANTAANATAVKVDGSAVTQPISATNLSTNIAQMNGVTTTMGNGVSGTGVQRVTLASDSTGQVTLATGSNTIGALTANQSVNIAQMNGVTTTMGNGVAGTGVQRVAIASDNSAVAGLGIGATGSAVPANAAYLGTSQSQVLKGVTGCDQHAFYDASDNGKKTVVAGTASKKTYVCGYILGTGGTATNLSLTSGTGTDCVTTSTAITPAYQLLANDRVGANSPFWNGLITLANADNLCVNSSAANAHQVEIWYTQQ